MHIDQSVKIKQFNWQIQFYICIRQIVAICVLYKEQHYTSLSLSLLCHVVFDDLPIGCFYAMLPDRDAQKYYCPQDACAINYLWSSNSSGSCVCKQY